jgi:hypothetical protein
MVAGGLMLWKRSRPVAAGLIGFGLTTVGYNTMNYFFVRDAQEGSDGAA